MSQEVCSNTFWHGSLTIPVTLHKGNRHRIRACFRAEGESRGIQRRSKQSAVQFSCSWSSLVALRRSTSLYQMSGQSGSFPWSCMLKMQMLKVTCTCKKFSLYLLLFPFPLFTVFFTVLSCTSVWPTNPIHPDTAARAMEWNTASYIKWKFFYHLFCAQIFLLRVLANVQTFSWWLEKIYF